jgi:TolA-binding protein
MIETSAELLSAVGIGLTVVGGISGKLLDRYFVKRREQAHNQSTLLRTIQDAQKHLTQTLFDTIEEMRLEINELRQELGQCETQHAAANARLSALQDEVTGMRCSMKQVGVDCPLISGACI